MLNFFSKSRERAGANDMTFLEHVEELRMTLWVCVAAFAASALLSAIFYKTVFDVLRIPLARALESLGDSELTASANAALTSMHFMDPFTILIYIALFGGIALSCPVILYKLAKFVAPALTSHEQRKIVPVCVAATALFFSGAAMAFFWLAPLSIRFMYFFSGEMGLQVNWLASDYYSFIVILVLFVGLMFEFPLAIIALQYLEIVSTRALVEKWRWVIAGILIASVLVSPIGDPVALLALTGVLFALYMASVAVGNFLLKKKLAARAREEAEFEAEFSAKKTASETPAREIAKTETETQEIVPAPMPAPVPEIAKTIPAVFDDDGDLRFIDE